MGSRVLFSGFRAALSLLALVLVKLMNVSEPLSTEEV